MLNYCIHYILLNSNTIYKLKNDGSFKKVLCFDIPQDSGGGFSAMAIDSNGDFFLSESSANLKEPTIFDNQAGTRIFRVEKTTGNISTFVNGLTGPAGIDFDSSDNLIVAELISGSLKKVNPQGEVVTLANGNFLANAIDIAFNDNESLIMCSAETGMLIKADDNATASKITVSPYVLGLNLFVGISESYAFTSIVYDDSGNLYIAEYAPDINRKGITKISSDEVITTLISDTVDSPNGLAIDNDGNLWVSNSISGKVEKYNSSGNLLGSSAALQTPSDITWYNGALYVAEYGANCITRVQSNFATKKIVNNVTNPVDLAFSLTGDMVIAAGGTLYLVEGPIGESATATVLASAFPHAVTLQGVTFDENNNAFVSVDRGNVIKITGFD